MIPVFIGGCERSGTTLLGSMLGANMQAVVLPESRFKYHIITGIRLKKSNDLICSGIMGDKKFKHFKIDTAGVKKIDFGALGIEMATTEFVKIYALDRAFPKPEPKYWIDHNPDNLASAKTLMENFPNARFIHIVRDGRAVASSVMGLDWGPNTILKAAQWWLQKLSLCLAAEIYLPAEKFMRVRYEDLVLDSETTLRKICGFLEMDFTLSMVTGDDSFVGPYTKRQHSLVGSAPQPSQVNNWTRKLSRLEVSCFEKYAGPMLDLLGYPREYAEYRNPASYQRMKWFLKENAVSVLNAIKKARRLRRSG